MSDDTPKHSTWGASKFESVMLCPGKLAMEVGKADTTSEYAAEGTAAHQVLTWALQENKPASAYVGREIDVEGYLFIVDDEMAEHVQHAMDFVHDVAGDDGVVMVDQRVNYSRQLDVPEDEGWGTLDVAVARGSELTVMDFKYGKGVMVEAAGEDDFGDPTPNPQLVLYAVGALNDLEAMFGEFQDVTLAICQPRVRAAASTFTTTRGAVMSWAEIEGTEVVGRAKAALALANDGADISKMLNPGEKQCKFCKAKASCPALRDEVSTEVHGTVAASPDEFADFVVANPDTAAWLAAALSKVDMIEDWCKAIRAEAERRMLAGEEVPGYKLVQGKRGARQWGDAKAAEEMLKTFRLKVEEMYDLKLISPTSAEKLAKAKTIGPRQWPKLAELITQSDGKLHVAPLSDKREPVTVQAVAADFDDGPPV